MLLLTFFLATLLPDVAVFFASAHDKHGWGLRLHRLAHPGPYLVGEPIDHTTFWATLVNFSNQERFHDPLVVAYDSRDLEVRVIAPDGEPLDALSVGDTRGGRDPFTVQLKVPARGTASEEFALANFGYYRVFEPGRHRVEAVFALRADGKRDGRVVRAPVVEFEVLSPKDETILSTFPISLGGWEAKRPVDKQQRVVVQQIKVGDRMFLIYRRYHSPNHIAQIEPALRPLAEIDSTRRLVDLPGKCEVTVTGTYDDGKPLTVTYKTSPTAEPVQLVINSVFGRPWTQEEEKRLQERLKREATASKKP